MPASRALEDVVECGLELGERVFEDAVAVVPQLAQRLGGERLLGELAANAGRLRELPRGTVVKMSPQGDPAISAAMMLGQRMQRGDRRAKEEIVGLAEAGCEDLIRKAGEKLSRGQRKKLVERGVLW